MCGDGMDAQQRRVGGRACAHDVDASARHLEALLEAREHARAAAVDRVLRGLRAAQHAQLAHVVAARVGIAALRRGAGGDKNGGAGLSRNAPRSRGATGPCAMLMHMRGSTGSAGRSGHLPGGPSLGLRDRVGIDAELEERLPVRAPQLLPRLLELVLGEEPVRVRLLRHLGAQRLRGAGDVAEVFRRSATAPEARDAGFSCSCD